VGVSFVSGMLQCSFQEFNTQNIPIYDCAGSITLNVSVPLVSGSVVNVAVPVATPDNEQSVGSSSPITQATPPGLVTIPISGPNFEPCPPVSPNQIRTVLYPVSNPNGELVTLTGTISLACQ
jgi:hypothetical protein